MIINCVFSPALSFLVFLSISFLQVSIWHISPVAWLSGTCEGGQGSNGQNHPVLSTGSQCSRRSPVMGEVFIDVFFFRRNEIPSRELTYPTWGKGKSFSNALSGGYVNFLEGTYLDPPFGC